MKTVFFIQNGVFNGFHPPTNLWKNEEMKFWTPNHLEKCIIIISFYNAFLKWHIMPHFQGGMNLSMVKLQIFKISIPT